MVDITVAEALASFGFSEKDQAVYLAILELGTATANHIAEKAKINRSTTYDILRLFIIQGVAAKIEKGRVTYFEAAAPEKLVSMLEEKKAKLAEVLPQLKVIAQQVVVKPTVQVFEGKEGMKTILADILAVGKQTDVLSPSKIFDILVFHFPRYIKERAESGIYARVIQEQSRQTEQLKKSDKNQLRETRSLPNFLLNSMIFIYGENIAIIKLSETEIISVLIRYRAIVDDQRSLFEVLWAAAR